MNKTIGKLLYSLSRAGLWRKPGASSAIDGSTTFGYGSIDENGFWKFPVFIE